MMDVEIKAISEALEKISKRLRKVEVLSRLSRDNTANTFLELLDAPDAYDGYAGWAVFVNNNEDAVEFQPVGGACVTFICGPIGWRGYGGTAVRTLVHEAAFQLDAGGNDRGDYAIDMQQLRGADVDVAAAEGSIIVGNEENRIEPGCSWSGIFGDLNLMFDTNWHAYQIGVANLVQGNGSVIWQLGVGNWAHDDCEYVVQIGSSHEYDAVFGCFSFIERCDMIANLNDYPLYNASGGVQNDMLGGVYNCFQFGQQNYMEGSGVAFADTTDQSAQFGYENYQAHVRTNYAFGRDTKSYEPAYTGFYDGRMLFSGDYAQVSPTDGTGFSGGFNQDSRFSQNMMILNWTVAWITSRFEFPIIPDSVWGFRAYILGTEAGCANSYDWEIQGAIENDGGVTTILWSAVTNNYRDVATKEWQVIADNVNDRLVFQFRDTGGPDATDCNIQFSMHTVEVGFE